MSCRPVLIAGVVLSLSASVVARSLSSQATVTPGGQAPAPGAAAQTKGTGLIAGRVVDASGAPLASAIVTLGGRAPQPAGRQAQGPRVLTDADGRYFFSDVAAGGYTIYASKPGFIGGTFGARRPGGAPIAIELANGERRGDLNCTLWRLAVISGRVADDTGDPMVDLDVRAFQQTFAGGRRQLAFAQRAKTDDRGQFRFANLMPGDYVIGVPATVTSEPTGFAGTIRAGGPDAACVSPDDDVHRRGADGVRARRGAGRRRPAGHVDPAFAGSAAG